MKAKLKQFKEIPFTHANMMSLLTEYSNPNDKISELLKTGEIIKIRRGLYVLGEFYDNVISRELLANHIYGPSYISLDYALSYYGLIPERVYDVTSITTRLAKEYNNKFGCFSYQKSPFDLYRIGLVSEFKGNYSFLIASKTKALCDKIIFTEKLNLRSQKDMLHFISEDLRIDFDDLADLDLTEIEACIEANRRVKQLTFFLELIKELNPDSNLIVGSP